MKKLILTSVVTSFTLTTGCVTASRYHALEDQESQTRMELAANKAKVHELEEKLGIASSEKTKLETDVADMQKALADLQKRREDTEKRLAEFRELTDRFKKLVDSGKLTVKVVKGRMMVGLSTDILFPSGSAKLAPAGKLAIREVTGVLKDLKDKNFQIEGHTDNVPIKSASFPSNWELASARAISVLNTMLEVGMPAERISIASYADTQPIAENETPEGKATNRRIAIVIVPDLSGLPGFDELNKISEEGSKEAPKAMPSPKPAEPTATEPPKNSSGAEASEKNE